MLHSSTKKLIDRLAEMTELGKLDWAESENGNVVYSTEGYSVHLTSDTSEVIITSIDGKELERASAGDLASAQTETGTSYTTLVAEMTSEAIRLARGTETAISTLLAGMDEPAEPEPEPEPAPVLTAAAPEDAVNETTALDADTAAPEAEMAESDETPDTTEPEIEQDAEPEAETDAAPPEPLATEMISDERADDTPEIMSEAAEPAFAAADMETAPDAATSETDAIEPSASDQAEDEDPERAAGLDADPSDVEMAFDASEDDASDDAFAAASDSVPTESEAELTEAVARLADEVNGRDETVSTPEPTPFVAPAFASTTSAETETIETAEPEAPSKPESLTAPETASAASVIARSYVPFGAEEMAAEAPAQPSSDLDDAPVEAEYEAAAEPMALSQVTVEMAESEIETTAEAAPELAAETESETVSDPAFASESEIETASDPIMAASDPEPEAGAPEPVDAIEPAAASEPAAPQSGFTSAFGTFMQETPEPPATSTDEAPEPELVEASANAPETTEIEAASAVSVASEPAQETAKPAYSLSGIGAGFGLGALSAKVEASGIPGPSTLSKPQTEKVVIDATGDVLPEAGETADTRELETASADNQIGAAQSGETAPDDRDPEPDMMKPRTRFNPWD